MVDSIQEAELVAATTPIPVTASEPLEIPLPDSPTKVQLKQLLANARNTKELLENSTVAVQNGSFQGRDSVAIALLLQFLAQIKAQNLADIKRIQAELG
jgi:hypothetical protein